jgi:hypothetical protein
MYFTGIKQYLCKFEGRGEAPAYRVELVIGLLGKVGKGVIRKYL